MDITDLFDRPAPAGQKPPPPISLKALLVVLLAVIVVGASLWGWVTWDSRAWGDMKAQYEEEILAAEERQGEDSDETIQEAESALQELSEQADRSEELLKKVGDELDSPQDATDLQEAITSARDMVDAGASPVVEVLAVESVERRVLLVTNRLPRKEFEISSGVDPSAADISHVSSALSEAGDALEKSHVQWGKGMLSEQVEDSEKVLKKSKKKVDDEKTRTALTKLITSARDLLRSEDPSVGEMRTLAEELEEASKGVQASERAKKESDKAKAAAKKTAEQQQQKSPSHTRPQTPSPKPSPSTSTSRPHPKPPSHTRPQATRAPTAPQRADAHRVRHLIAQQGRSVTSSCGRVIASSSASTMPAAKRFVSRYPKVRQFAVSPSGAGVAISACASG